MQGKEKCRILKELRKKIAEENDITFVTAECTHKGNCKGTCPKCEAEVRYLEEELEKRQSARKRVALAGMAAGFALMAGGCDIVDNAIDDVIDRVDDAVQVVRRIWPFSHPPIDVVDGQIDIDDQLMGDICIIDEPMPDEVVGYLDEQIDAPASPESLNHPDEEIAK